MTDQSSYLYDGKLIIKFLANFNGHASFGEFKNKTSIAISEKKSGEDSHGPKFDKDYSGKAGSGNIHVNIKTEFGDVIPGNKLQVYLRKRKINQKGK